MNKYYEHFPGWDNTSSILKTILVCESTPNISSLPYSACCFSFTVSTFVLVFFSPICYLIIITIKISVIISLELQLFLNLCHLFLSELGPVLNTIQGLSFLFLIFSLSIIKILTLLSIICSCNWLMHFNLLFCFFYCILLKFLEFHRILL